ncbi:MAG: hypothetical protein NTW21_38085 [Verrucomicrobia bacterium]|nr:hypothetical protein [Verrucomicrobiota bacterium]
MPPPPRFTLEARQHRHYGGSRAILSKPVRNTPGTLTTGSHHPALGTTNPVQRFNRRSMHSSLTHVTPPVYKKQDGSRPYQERLILEGMSKKTPAELATLARSWLHAPPIKALWGCKAMDYNQAKREYPLVAAAPAMSVAIAASQEQPLVNVCFTVKNWGSGGAASVLMNGKKPAAVRQDSTACQLTECTGWAAPLPTPAGRSG